MEINMIGYCTKNKREVLIEAECHFCKDIDLTLCRHWQDDIVFSALTLIEYIENIQDNTSTGTYNSMPTGFIDGLTEIIRAKERLKDILK